jgi:hypothetical protein
MSKYKHDANSDNKSRDFDEEKPKKKYVYISLLYISSYMHLNLHAPV